MELNNILNSIGWTILNSIWQGFFILMLLMISMLFIKTKHSKIRSILAFASLIFLFAASIRTFVDLNTEGKRENIKISQTVSAETYGLAVLHEPSPDLSEKSENKSTFWNTLLLDLMKLGNKNIHLIVLVWLLGVSLMSLRLFGGFLYIQKLKTRHIFKVDQKWLNMVDDLIEKMQIKRTVKLLESAIVKAPMVLGYFKPVILMPLGTLAEMPVKQIEMILAHEIAHIKQSDYLLNLIQSFLEVIYFFNPAVWIISKIIRTEREFVCDDLALSVNNNSTLLAKALLAIQIKETKRPLVALSALGTKNSLLGRIKRMKEEKNISVYPKKLAFSVILVGALLTITIVACSSSLDKYNQENGLNIAAVNVSEKPLPVTLAEPVNDINDIEGLTIIKKPTKMEFKEGKRKFNFHKDDTHWKGTVKDGKLITLYKDGQRIPDDKIGDHEDFIIDTLEEIDIELAGLAIDMENLKVDLKDLKNDLKDIDLNIDLDHIAEMKNHFNSTEFQEAMEQVRESIKDMKIEFNDEWKEELTKALEHVKDIDIDLEHFKSQEFKHEMENLRHELKHLKDIETDFDFDKESFKESLKDIKIDMADFDIDLSDLKIEMKKLKGFIKDLKTDLVSEGYLSDEDDDFEMHLSKSELTLDGKKLPDNLKTKYLKMYEKHFGKELEDEFNIRN